MKAIPHSFIPVRWLIAGVVGLTLQACKTPSGGNTTPATPFVVSFDFQEPVQTTAAEKARFVKALELAVPERSKVVVDGQQVWPTATLRTERVITGGAGGGDEAHIVSTRGTAATPPHVGVAHAAKDTRIGGEPGMGKTYQTRLASTHKMPFDKAFVARAKSTQYVAFKSEADMRAFLRVLGGGKK